MKRIGIFFIVSLFLLSCNQKPQEQKNQNKEVKPNDIEVLYFHGKQRCKSCVAIELRTKDMLNMYFAQEMKEGKIAFKTVDFSLKENEPIADKYQIAFSSLLLVKHENEKETVKDLTDFGFSYAYKNPEMFMSGLKEEIDSLLKL
jgi:hypothetical protein